MNQKNKPEIESLASSLLDRYQQVESLVALIEQSDTNVERADLFEQLNAALAEVKNIESTMAPLRTEIANQGDSVPAETRALVDQTVSIVTRLIPRLGTLEERAKKERIKLAPQIHDGVRALQMQSAYGQNR